MRTHTEKALNSGHSVGEHACLEACKTESTSVGFLIENLFLEIISFSRPDEVDQLLLEFAQDIFGRRENGQDMIEFRDSKLIGHENFTFKRKSRRKTFPLRESVAKFFFTDGPVLFEKVVSVSQANSKKVETSTIPLKIQGPVDSSGPGSNPQPLEFLSI